MSVGSIISLAGVRAEAPKQVTVSDGSIAFPYGHYEYFTRNQPDGMLLLNLARNEYSEFRVDTNRNFFIRLWNHEKGARYKLFVYRTTADPIIVAFDGEVQTLQIDGGETPQIDVINVEVIEFNNGTINKVVDNIYDDSLSPNQTWSSKKIFEEIGKVQNNVDAKDSDSIPLSKDIVFNGVEQGAYADGDQMNQGDTLTTILTKFAQKALPTIYTAPTFGITPNSQNIEAGSNVNPTIIPAWVQNDAGLLNRYLLLLSVAGGANSTLLDLAALQNYNQALIQVGDGQYLRYTAQAYYDEGLTKNNNLGDPDPVNKILAGVKEDTLVYTGFRKLFYGTPAGYPIISDEIRALPNSLLNPVNGSVFTLNIAAGTTFVVFAYPGTLRDVSSVKYLELGNAEVKDTFELLNFDVAGANGYVPLNYKIYVYEPAVPFGDAATYNITI